MSPPPCTSTSLHSHIPQLRPVPPSDPTPTGHITTLQRGGILSAGSQRPNRSVESVNAANSSYDRGRVGVDGRIGPALVVLFAAADRNKSDANGNRVLTVAVVKRRKAVQSPPCLPPLLSCPMRYLPSHPTPSPLTCASRLIEWGTLRCHCAATDCRPCSRSNGGQHYMRPVLVAMTDGVAGEL